MDKILTGYIEDFIEQQGFEEQNPKDVFQHFVNHCVISNNSTDSFDLLDACTDGTGDFGIDGIAILVDGHILSSIEDVDFYIDKLVRLNVDFLFVQSKASGRFKAAEIGNFLHGIKLFFESQLPEEANESIYGYHEIKEYIYRCSIKMQSPPRCLAYYASPGEWVNDSILCDRIEKGRKELEESKLFSEVIFDALDLERLKSGYRALRNKVVCEITFERQTTLPQISGVQEAYLGILPCQEYLKLITNEDDNIRLGVFYDNVRDFQGHNPVNKEISGSLINPEKNDQFALLNNGVTVVAKSINRVGEKFKISDYQIVNGCQTSHVLFSNRAKIKHDVYIPVKLVVTDDPEVTNSVIRATNRQTEIKIEAFESLEPFHRTLEEFYSSFEKNPDCRLYYERRSKQYNFIPVDPKRVVSLATQCKAFMAMFLEEPHSWPRYYGEILNSYRGRMFQEDHRPFPYYASAYTLTKIETYFRSRKLPGQKRNFRYHILMLIRKSIMGGKVPPMSSKNMDGYCEKLCAVLWDDQKLFDYAQEAIGKISDAMLRFTGDRKIAARLRSFTAELGAVQSKRPAGKINYFNLERGFGFIKIPDIDGDVFVHISSLRGTANQYLNIGDSVECDVVKTDKGMQAVDVRLLQMD